jgi:hypothetical protein
VLFDAVKKFLIILTLLCFVSIVGAWVSTGSHVGWSSTQVQVMKTDPVTELEFPEWEPRITLGLDFLGLGLAGCAILGAIAFFVPKKRRQTLIG